MVTAGARRGWVLASHGKRSGDAATHPTVPGTGPPPRSALAGSVGVRLRNPIESIWTDGAKLS